MRFDNTVTWLASWTENIQNSLKYIMLNPSSKLKVSEMLSFVQGLWVAGLLSGGKGGEKNVARQQKHTFLSKKKEVR